MMKTIVEEKPISFKELEQKIFSYVCELGREITTAMLEAYDKELAEGRDKKNYRGKGIRTNTIKTVYGEVSYGRHVYQTKLEDGKKACVYLLDESHADGKDRADLHKPGREAGHDGNRSAVPRYSRDNKQHLRPEHQCRRCVERDAAVG